MPVGSFPAERAVASSGGRPRTMVSLAPAHAADGQFDNAVAVAGKALALARRAGEPELAQRSAGYLDHYKKAKAPNKKAKAP